MIMVKTVTVTMKRTPTDFQTINLYSHLNTIKKITAETNIQVMIIPIINITTIKTI